MKFHAPRYSCTPAKQRGIALITSLILLVVMTLLGLAAIRSITQEERMAGHSYARSLHFQATESALRQAEALVEAPTIKPVPTAAGCNVVSGLMLCATPAAADTPRWKDTTFAAWQDFAAIGSGTLAVTPQYFVEYLGIDVDYCSPPGGGTACKRYRITARSSDGSDGKTLVMLQSNYVTYDD